MVSSVAATIAAAISAIVNVLQLSFLFGGGDEDGPLGTVGAFAAMLLAPLGAMLLQLGALGNASTWRTPPPRSCAEAGPRWQTPWKRSPATEPRCRSTR